MACGAEGPERWHGNAWNTRPIEDALRARIAALEAKCERMAKCIEAGDVRPFPVQGERGFYRKNSIPWWIALLAWKAYERAGFGGQTAERIAERGGFDWAELGQLLVSELEARAAVEEGSR